MNGIYWKISIGSFFSFAIHVHPLGGSSSGSFYLINEDTILPMLFMFGKWRICAIKFAERFETKRAEHGIILLIFDFDVEIGEVFGVIDARAPDKTSFG